MFWQDMRGILFPQNWLDNFQWIPKYTYQLFIFLLLTNVKVQSTQSCLKVHFSLGDLHCCRPQISTRIDCLWVKTNQANWTLVKNIKKSQFFYPKAKSKLSDLHCQLVSCWFRFIFSMQHKVDWGMKPKNCQMNCLIIMSNINNAINKKYRS